MKEIEIKTIIKEFESIDSFNSEIKELINKSKEVTGKSYAPYSNFNVGAAVLLENGMVITGSNQENAAYPSGLCAERVALFYANSQYPEVPVKAIAIAASKEKQLQKEPVTPCGSCRQVMLETEIRFQKAIQIYLIGEEKIFLIENVHDLLPVSFEGSFLKKARK